MDTFAAVEQDGPGDITAPIPRPSFPPKGSALVDSYRQDALNGFEIEKPGANTMNSEHMQSSVFVNMKDSVQIHLLTETALFDSKDYVILSEDVVEDLKKQCQSLTQSIEQARSNLTIQSKYRDAAVSVTRLYSPTGKESLLGNHLSSGSDAAREAEAERDAIQKKCEDLAAELWSLEQRLMTPQRTLLEHTAGILQHAHKMARKTANASSKPLLVNGVPASPESMHAMSNGRNSPDFLEDGFVFDEASLYRSFNIAEKPNSLPRQTSIGIPPRSPVREQTKQLVEETDKLRQENEQLRSEIEALQGDVEGLRQQEAEQWNLISETERKLEKFNHQLREAVVQTDPTRHSDFDPVPTGQQDTGDALNSHLHYLENALALVGENYENTSEIARSIQLLGSKVQDILTGVDHSYPHAPPPTEDVEKQLEYLEESLRSVDEHLQLVSSATQQTSIEKENSEQADTVLMGLWDIIQSGYADIRHRKQERRRMREEKGLEPDEGDLSDGDSIDLNEIYSLNAFSSKVQWLYTQATRLNEQKAVLKRQIKQQRELNNKSDLEKDQQLHDKESELEEANLRASQAERETYNARSQLSQALEQIEDLQNGREEEIAVIEESREQLKQRNTRIASLEAQTRDMVARLTATEANFDAITAQLREAHDAKDTAERAAEERQDIIKAQKQELEQMTGMVAELKMETAMTKAELDGAYGSRKQRAAEVAALHNTSQSVMMKSRVETLEQELKSTTNDLTNVVKQSVESEKKIAELEADLDQLKAERDRVRHEQENMNEELERQLHEARSDIEEKMNTEIARLRKEKEQVQDELDIQRLKVADGSASSSGASRTSYLTESFRTGLRAERKKHEEQLKAEQMLRRKVEDELRALKRAHGPGKSSLSVP
ncbi:hypothetical protein GGS21DRAFT_522299 [Xylaria nigripes]|nr:hypothetical protein GGS21DRAFT_522299 [Xylaria nigripes]